MIGDALKAGEGPTTVGLGIMGMPPATIGFDAITGDDSPATTCGIATVIPPPPMGATDTAGLYRAFVADSDTTANFKRMEASMRK
jgi:hypothetical protein